MNENKIHIRLVELKNKKKKIIEKIPNKKK